MGMNLPVISIQRITPEQTYPARHAVLRRGLPVETCRFEGDHASATVHFGAVMQEGGADAVVGVVTLMQHRFPGDGKTSTRDPPAVRGSDTDLQLRGMAVLEAVQAQGVGRQLIAACHEHARQAGAATLWCNARLIAVPFYEKCGWRVVSEEFMIPTAGPHFRMVWTR